MTTTTTTTTTTTKTTYCHSGCGRVMFWVPDFITRSFALRVASIQAAKAQQSEKMPTPTGFDSNLAQQDTEYFWICFVIIKCCFFGACFFFVAVRKGWRGWMQSVTLMTLNCPHVAGVLTLCLQLPLGVFCWMPHTAPEQTRNASGEKWYMI